MLRTTLLALGFTTLVSAHVAAFKNGMYCKGGNDSSVDNGNTNTVVNPLYMLAKEDWWFQHDRGCDKVPPKDGEILELPANGEFTVELAHNRGQTSLTDNCAGCSDWPDGKQHPEDWNGWNAAGTESVCLPDDGAMHTYNQSWQGATAFAISYNNNIAAVTLENLVVFTTLDHTPWKRLATYQVPDLPACPEGGCTCAWLWVPNQCGTANTYMQGFKCTVTGASPTAKPVGAAKPPVYCEGQPDKCVKGPKQMIAWHQLTGNNIVVPDGATPNYNHKCGWGEGAQTDIFADGASPAPPASSSAAPSSTSSSSSSTTAAVPTTAQTTTTAAYPTTLATRTSAIVTAASSVVKDSAPTTVASVAVTTVTSVATSYVTKVSTSVSVSVSTAYVTMPAAACTIRKPRHSHY